MKSSKKLTAYKKALAEIADTRLILDGISDKLKETGEIYISSNVILQPNSSDKQYIFALGVLNSQINASKELGIDSKELDERKAVLLSNRTLWKEREEWHQYHFELTHYVHDLKKLLSDDDKFQLLEYPQKA
jgi:hypothetical protein